MITLLALELKELFVINSQFSEKEESRLFTKEADLTFHKNKNTNTQIYKYILNRTTYKELWKIGSGFAAVEMPATMSENPTLQLRNWKGVLGRDERWRRWELEVEGVEEIQTAPKMVPSTSPTVLKAQTRFISSSSSPSAAAWSLRSWSPWSTST